MNRLVVVAGFAVGVSAAYYFGARSSEVGAREPDLADQGSLASAAEWSAPNPPNPLSSSIPPTDSRAALEPDSALTADSAAEPARAPRKVDYVAFLEEVQPGDFDPLSLAVADGIVWYGTWEAAMAEYERTGKPVMLHFGSPRCPDNEVCVPGTW